LRDQLQIDLMVDHHLLQQFVFPHIRSDVADDLPVCEKQTHAQAVDPDVVTDCRQILCAASLQCPNQIFRHAA
jgi:hypothetical protein